MAGNGDIMDGIEPCRTCGIFYLTTSNFLRQIFDSTSDEYDLSHIRTELTAWSIEMNRDDGLPQYICTCCILEFQKLFKFRGLCVELQEQWRHFYNIRQENKVYIKKELPDPDEKTENLCDFIYVDDLSENEFNVGGGGSFKPFNIPHVPIKEELTEDPPVLEDSIVSAVKETFTTNNTMESSGGALQSHTINYLTNADLNILDSPETQLLFEPVNKDSSLQLNQDIPASVQCNLCRHLSATTELHGQHMQRIHEMKDMVCHICGKQFKNSTVTRLKFHMKWHRISKHIKCAQCGFFCGSRETLKEHTRAIHSKIECTTCGKRVLGKKMRVHMRTHELRSWPCSYCDDVFQTENSLEAHIWQIHAQEETIPIAIEENNKLLTEQQRFSCSHCDQFYSTQHELNTHKMQCNLMETTTETESYAETDLPNEPFQYKDPTDVLQMPITIFQPIDQSAAVKEDSSHTCSNNTIAQVISSDEETCESESHSEALKELACPKCTQTFYSTEELCMHYQQHIEKSGFSCHICGKSFELKFTLNRHIKKHKSP